MQTEYELVPVAWDNGFDGDYGFCLINRYSCQVTHQDIIDAMMEIYRASSTATGIALDQQEITIHVGDAGTQLNATLTPSDSKDVIKWTSDDEKVATVNCGWFGHSSGCRYLHNYGSDPGPDVRQRAK